VAWYRRGSCRGERLSEERYRLSGFGRVALRILGRGEGRGLIRTSSKKKKNLEKITAFAF